MLRQLTLNLTLFLFGSDVVLTIISLYLAKLLRLSLPYGVEVLPKHLTFPWIIYLIVGAIWGVIFLILPVYEPRKTYRAIDQLQVLSLAVGFATLVFAGVAYFFFRELSRFLFLYFFLLDFAFLLMARILLRLGLRIWRGGWPGRRTRLLILGAGPVGERVGRLLNEAQLYGVEIAGFLDDEPSQDIIQSGQIPYLGGFERTIEIVKLQRIDEVILALPGYAHKQLVGLVQQLQNLGVTVRLVPDLFELSFVKTSVEDFEGLPLIRLGEPVMAPFQQLIKRGFDLVAGGLLLLLALPVMLLVALLIKLDSPGAAFYFSERVGQNGRIFKMWKFRSMVSGAHHRREEVVTYTPDGRPIHKQPDDPRVTKIGKIIRQTSLDELPQLFNVIKGEMSLIGPRPEMPWLVEMYEPWQYKRFSVPQGMTGWWQVNGRSDKPMHFHVEEDLYYIQNYSLLLDLIIIWKTIGAVVKRGGAF